MSIHAGQAAEYERRHSPIWAELEATLRAHGVETYTIFLDDASGNDLHTLRIIHGYGTGQLRRSIAEFLRTHPFVSTFGPAPGNQGGGGVTVVELKE